MIVDGERITKSEVRRLIKFFDHECKEAAGEFFDQCRKGAFGDPGRTEKFRAFWSEVGLRCGRDPQTCYVESHYQNFAEDVRRGLAGLLARPDVPEHDKQTIHRALIVQETLAINSQHTPIQIARDSQQFVGDAHEVKQIAITHGNHVEPAVMQQFLNTTAIKTRH